MYVGSSRVMLEALPEQTFVRLLSPAELPSTRSWLSFFPGLLRDSTIVVGLWWFCLCVWFFESLSKLPAGFLSSIFMLYLENQVRLESREFSSLILSISCYINYVLVFYWLTCCLTLAGSGVLYLEWFLCRELAGVFQSTFASCFRLAVSKGWC